MAKVSNEKRRRITPKSFRTADGETAWRPMEKFFRLVRTRAGEDGQDLRTACEAYHVSRKDFNSISQQVRRLAEGKINGAPADLVALASDAQDIEVNRAGRQSRPANFNDVGLAEILGEVADDLPNDATE